MNADERRCTFCLSVFIGVHLRPIMFLPTCGSPPRCRPIARNTDPAPRSAPETSGPRGTFL